MKSDLNWKAKAILNYIASVMFIVLAIVHIHIGKNVSRVIADIIPAMWFGIIATIYLKRHYKKQ